jgi:serine/threonine-protein kinase HipA
MMHYNPEETSNDYMDMFRIAQKLNLSQEHKEQMAKVILFNAIFGNRDDHSRNFSFLMNKEGKWAFAPAYDLTYTSNGYHQMLLGSYSLNRATFGQLKNAFKPYNISESFLKENIKIMIDIKHNKLVKECNNLNIPKKLANQILEETKIVDEMFTKGDYL